MYGSLPSLSGVVRCDVTVGVCNSLILIAIGVDNTPHGESVVVCVAIAVENDDGTNASACVTCGRRVCNCATSWEPNPTHRRPLYNRAGCPNLLFIAGNGAAEYTMSLDVIQASNLDKYRDTNPSERDVGPHWFRVGSIFTRGSI